MAELSIVLVNYNTAHLLDECLAAVRVACAGLDVQIIMVDNASRDASLSVLRERHADVELIVNERNVGFGRANNQTLPQLSAPLLLLLNTDAFVAPDAIVKARDYMLGRPEVGILGARLLGRDGELQPCCRYFPTPLNKFALATGLGRWLGSPQPVDDMDWDHASARDCDWVPGCFYLVRRELVDRIGLFDPRYFLYMEEVDHCRAAAAAGWKVVFFADAHVVHIGGESARSDGPISDQGRQVSALQMESELLYYRKWLGLKGVLLHVFLCLLAALMTACKRLLRPRPGGGIVTHLSAAALWLRLATRTALGARATR